MMTFPEHMMQTTKASEMYLLGWLREEAGKPARSDTITTEYRLICSGELYNSDVRTTDWRKSDPCRWLATTMRIGSYNKQALRFAKRVARIPQEGQHFRFEQPS